ncbi:MAG: molecular chaperone GrpE [Actinomycetota bacterium]|nr:molecular chaperone GrpE [Actinomycetota bacterium]
MTDPTETQRPVPPEEPDERESQGPIIRDKRRIDPETGAVREPSSSSSSWQPAAGAPPQGQPAPETSGAGAAAEADQAGELAQHAAQQLAERTADLQRLQAEYANYRRRVERDREATREQAIVAVLTNLLPVLDDVGRAREHGELEGGFKSVGEALEATVGKLGLTQFGEPGEPFDPTVHEALTHSHSADVTEPTCVQVFQPGYRIGDRVVRPARVAVADPE